MQVRQLPEMNKSTLWQDTEIIKVNYWSDIGIILDAIIRYDIMNNIYWLMRKIIKGTDYTSCERD